MFLSLVSDYNGCKHRVLPPVCRSVLVQAEERRRTKNYVSTMMKDCRRMLFVVVVDKEDQPPISYVTRTSPNKRQSSFTVCFKSRLQEYPYFHRKLYATEINGTTNAEQTKNKIDHQNLVVCWFSAQTNIAILLTKSTNTRWNC